MRRIARMSPLGGGAGKKWRSGGAYKNWCGTYFES
jgi:hypothetical protein